MKKVALVLAMATLFIGSTVLAGSLDGSYSFVSRVKDGKPALEGWTGTMKIENNLLVRNLKSKDGAETRFYETTMTDKGGDVYVLKTIKAYKPEYIGDEQTNKITAKGNLVTLQSLDGKFNEVWQKK